MIRRRAGKPAKRANPETAGWRLTPTRLGWLTVSTVLVVVPHLFRQPFWVGATFALLVLWRVFPLRHGPTTAVQARIAGRGAGRWVLSAVALVLIAAVLASYGTLLGRNPGVATLSLLAAVKLLEIRSDRDAYTACFLGFFLVVTNFLFDQSIPTALYMFVVVVVMTATLQVVASEPAGGAAMRAPRRLVFASKLLAQALPIMLVMFVLFPRVPGPLWGLPKDAHAGVSGLSDRMSPGAISNLSLSDEVAFRVRFDGGQAPATSRLYWRGPVFWDTDGFTWNSVRRAAAETAAPQVETFGESVDYTVTLEPHQQRWLFTLEMPESAPPRSRLGRDMDVTRHGPVRERIRYRAHSYLDYRYQSLAPAERRRALALPRGKHPRARALAARWLNELRIAAGGAPGRRLVDRSLAHFATEPFFYSLRPPPLEQDPVDQFLFGTRHGFCEHYAAAFTVLMRAAGIPARVVTGYQGGEFNPVGDYLIVRQRDAHAWSEVYLDGEGWIRVDPTAAVSPERIEQGMDAAIPPTLGTGLLSIEPGAGVMALWRAVRRRVDAINNGWNQWVLGYGPERQRRFLERLGIDARKLGLVVGLLLAAVLALLTAVALWLSRRRAPADPAARAYNRFCRKLARAGIARRPSEGPRDFAARVAAVRPEYAARAARVTALYMGLRYGLPDGGDARALARLRTAVARL